MKSTAASGKSWLVLLYGLPTKRGAERVSLWRKLRKFGAAQLKSSAYVLPDEPTHYERFQWLAKQIQDDGGEATLIRVAEIEGMSDDQIAHLFIEARAAEYRELMAAGREVLKALKKLDPETRTEELGKLQRRYEEIRAIDYFNTPPAHDAEVLLRQVGTQLGRKQPLAALPRLDPARFSGKVWVTRPRPGIDRVGSAWLIRKFIDAKARFVFAAESASHPDALPFDMAEGEFSHHGDDCTFETLVRRFGIKDRVVLQIAEMVHDADLEDGKFEKCECIGINAVLSGWARTGIKDDALLAKGIECFEGLYRELRK